MLTGTRDALLEEWSRKVFAENEQDEWPISWGPDEGQESPVSDGNRIFFFQSRKNDIKMCRTYRIILVRVIKFYKFTFVEIYQNYGPVEGLKRLNFNISHMVHI